MINDIILAVAYTIAGGFLLFLVVHGIFAIFDLVVRCAFVLSELYRTQYSIRFVDGNGVLGLLVYGSTAWLFLQAVIGRVSFWLVWLPFLLFAIGYVIRWVLLELCMYSDNTLIVDDEDFAKYEYFDLDTRLDGRQGSLMENVDFFRDNFDEIVERRLVNEERVRKYLMDNLSLWSPYRDSANKAHLSKLSFQKEPHEYRTDIPLPPEIRRARQAANKARHARERLLARRRPVLRGILGEKVIHVDDHIDMTWVLQSAGSFLVLGLYLILPWWITAGGYLESDPEILAAMDSGERFLYFFEFFLVYNGALLFIGSHAGAVFALGRLAESFDLIRINGRSP